MILTDLAAWRGPTPNCGPAMTAHLGLVVHIAEGTFEGTISWCLKKSTKVAPHFVVGRDGQVAQLIDTDTRSWCQAAGNPAWLSVECEGFTRASEHYRPGWEIITDAQLTAIARLLARCHAVYGVPLQVATSPSGRGLGHHSMGADWGHRDCPGPSIIAQKPEIVARAVRLAQGGDGDDMAGSAELIAAIAGGVAKMADGTVICPTVWRQRDEAWQVRVSAQLAADETRDAGLRAAIDALAEVIRAGGGSVDAAAICTKVDEAVKAIADRIEQEHQAEIRALRAQLEALTQGAAS
jgi:hypothetical protein